MTTAHQLKALVLSTGILVTTSCTSYFPLDRPGYDPAGVIDEHGRAYVWSEGYRGDGTDVNRITHGGVYITGTSYRPDPDLADVPTRMGIEGNTIGYRTLSYVGPGDNPRYFLTWQVGDRQIYGEFRSGNDLTAIPGAGGISLTGTDSNLTQPQTVNVTFGVAETVVEGQQYDVAYNEAANQLLVTWRVSVAGQNRIAYRLINATTGELGEVKVFEEAPATDDSWPQVAASTVTGGDVWDFCVTYINENSGGKAVYAHVVKVSGETYGPFNIDTSFADTEGRAGNHLRAAVAWRPGLGFYIAYDSNDGVFGRMLIPPTPAIDEGLIGQGVRLSVPRQGDRNTPILLDYNELSDEYALAYYEQEPVACSCSGSTCPCDGRAINRYVLYGQKLSASFMPEMTGTVINRLRIFPAERSMFSDRVFHDSGDIEMHWLSAGRADLTARDTARVIVEKHTFAVRKFADGRTGMGWKPDLLKLDAHLYSRR